MIHPIRIAPGFYWVQMKFIEADGPTIARVFESGDVTLLGTSYSYDVHRLRKEYNILGPVEEPK